MQIHLNLEVMNQGTTVTLGTGEYDVSVVNPPADYLQEYSADCRGTITLANETKTCNITNTIPSNIEFTSTIEVTKIVTPRLEAGDVFIMEVRGAPANPSKFGMLPGTTTVKMIGGNIYEIVETSMPPQLTGSHIAHYSDGCKGSITFQEVKSCVIENKPSERVNCLDGMDNDGDGRIDLNDEDCLAPPPPPETVCNDGQDNDRDGRIDSADEDCPKPTFTNPTGEIGAALNALYEDNPEQLEVCKRWSRQGEAICPYIWGPRTPNPCANYPGAHLHRPGNFCHVEVIGNPDRPTELPFHEAVFGGIREDICPSWTTVACVAGYIPGYPPVPGYSSESLP